eukprot:TRINITY_DN16371_c4_g1_i1.p1 TRINITY_DN16371_c4_g1~~TRINITY_DN16371_c4_g1_i1.p1  ORF type:complete len:840 (+),score=159.79 TRINITY_DN16371_c4_g1_i1:71-2590(+)
MGRAPGRLSGVPGRPVLLTAEEESRGRAAYFSRIGGVTDYRGVRFLLYQLGQGLTANEIEAVCGQVGFREDTFLQVDQLLEILRSLKETQVRGNADPLAEAQDAFRAVFERTAEERRRIRREHQRQAKAAAAAAAATPPEGPTDGDGAAPPQSPSTPQLRLDAIPTELLKQAICEDFAQLLDVDQLIADARLGPDGSINFEEFRNLISGHETDEDLAQRGATSPFAGRTATSAGGDRRRSRSRRSQAKSRNSEVQAAHSARGADLERPPGKQPSRGPLLMNSDWPAPRHVDTPPLTPPPRPVFERDSTAVVPLADSVPQTTSPDTAGGTEGPELGPAGQRARHIAELSQELRHGMAGDAADGARERMRLRKLLRCPPGTRLESSAPGSSVPRRGAARRGPRSRPQRRWRANGSSTAGAATGSSPREPADDSGSAAAAGSEPQTDAPPDALPPARCPRSPSGASQLRWPDGESSGSEVGLAEAERALVALAEHPGRQHVLAAAATASPPPAPSRRSSQPTAGVLHPEHTEGILRCRRAARLREAATELCKAQLAKDPPSDTWLLLQTLPFPAAHHTAVEEHLSAAPLIAPRPSSAQSRTLNRPAPAAMRRRPVTAGAVRCTAPPRRLRAKIAAAAAAAAAARRSARTPPAAESSGSSGNWEPREARRARRSRGTDATTAQEDHEEDEEGEEEDEYEERSSWDPASCAASGGAQEFPDAVLQLDDAAPPHAPEWEAAGSAHQQQIRDMLRQVVGTRAPAPRATPPNRKHSVLRARSRVQLEASPTGRGGRAPRRSSLARGTYGLFPSRLSLSRMSTRTYEDVPRHRSEMTTTSELGLHVGP